MTSMPPFNLPAGTVLESVATRCAPCGDPVVAVRVQTDTGVSWGAVELWCGSYRPHICEPEEAEGAAA